eukprot:scaffold2277_cov256-Pinguiococcus_pyrenoidosus.AAC.15
MAGKLAALRDHAGDALQNRSATWRCRLRFRKRIVQALASSQQLRLLLCAVEAGQVRTAHELYQAQQGLAIFKRLLGGEENGALFLDPSGVEDIIEPRLELRRGELLVNSYDLLSTCMRCEASKALPPAAGRSDKYCVRRSLPQQPPDPHHMENRIIKEYQVHSWKRLVVLCEALAKDATDPAHTNDRLVGRPKQPREKQLLAAAEVPRQLRLDEGLARLLEKHGAKPFHFDRAGKPVAVHAHRLVQPEGNKVILRLRALSLADEHRGDEAEEVVKSEAVVEVLGARPEYRGDLLMRHEGFADDAGGGAHDSTGKSPRRQVTLQKGEQHFVQRPGPGLLQHHHAHAPQKPRIHRHDAGPRVQGAEKLAALCVFKRERSRVAPGASVDELSLERRRRFHPGGVRRR